MNADDLLKVDETLHTELDRIAQEELQRRLTELERQATLLATRVDDLIQQQLAARDRIAYQKDRLHDLVELISAAAPLTWIAPKGHDNPSALGTWDYDKPST